MSDDYAVDIFDNDDLVEYDEYGDPPDQTRDRLNAKNNDLFRWDGGNAAFEFRTMLAEEHKRQMERDREANRHTERLKEMELEILRLQTGKDHKHEIDLKEIESRLRIAEAQNIQPIEVQKLLIQAMGRYGEMREKALDEAIRNPALRDQLRSRSMGYQEMQTITQETIHSLMSSELPLEAKKALRDEYIKRLGQSTDDYLKKLSP